MRNIPLAALSLLLMAAASAQNSTNPPVSAVPQQTTASFGNWVLRCTRSDKGQHCEIAQSISSHDKIVAEIALGHIAQTKPFHLTILVPPAISFGNAPVLVPGRDGAQPPIATMGWRRCLPMGCMAETILSDDTIHHLRSWTDSGRILFPDAMGRIATLPFSPTGLPQALDALAKAE